MIRFDQHSLKRAKERGATRSEIIDTLESGYSIPAKYSRLGKGKVYDFRGKRKGKYYDQKKVEVYYQEENESIIVITIYVFYGRWEWDCEH